MYDETNEVPETNITPDGATPVESQEGVTGDPPTPTGANPQPGAVPYDRFSEVNTKYKASEQRVKELEAQQLEYYQREHTQAPQQAQEPAFDAETAAAIRQTAGVQDVQDQLVLLQLQQKYPDFGEKQTEFFQVYHDMRQSGMAGTMAVADAIMAKIGDTTADTVNQMVTEQVQRETTKAEVAVPDGTTPAPVKPKSWEDMSEADIIAHNEKMAAEALLRAR